MLLRLAEAYDVDLKSFAAEGGEGTGIDQLAEIFADPMFGGFAVPRYELVEMADNAPAAADAVSRLYAALVELRRQPAAQDEGAAPLSPQSWVRDHIQAQRNHFPALEEAAETLAGALGDPLTIAEPLRRRLKEGFGIEARIMPPETLDAASQHYDLHRKRLMLSALLRPESRTFGFGLPARPDGVPAAAGADDRSRRAAGPADPAAAPHEPRQLRRGGAIMMPYAPFLEAAEKHRYDIDRLCAAFGASVEQVAHRLTTLNRNNARGIPFFMLRVDAAGNISKRFAGDAFPFSRFGGTCPRWNLHSAFQTPGRVVTQIVETPDGQRFFTIGRTVERSIRLDPREDSQLAIGLGCDVKYAPRIAYADGLDLADPYVTPIGPACAICPRVRCPQRAAAPAGMTLSVNETRKTISPFPFLGAARVSPLRRNVTRLPKAASPSGGGGPSSAVARRVRQ